MQNENTPPKETNAANQKTEVALDGATCSSSDSLYHERLSQAGVFKGLEGLRGLLCSDSFWENQPYGTRLYYGDGVADYLHRDVLRAAVQILETNAELMHRLPSAAAETPNQKSNHE